MFKIKKSLTVSVITLVLCIAMLAGTTFAWFTDSATSANNIIKSGNLDIEMYWTTDMTLGVWNNAEDSSKGPVFDYEKWEPGYTSVRYIKIVNAGSLAFKYSLNLITDGEAGILGDVIDVYYVEDVQENITTLNNLTRAGVLNDVIDKSISAGGVLLPANESKAGYYSGDIVIAIALHMQESAGNEYQNQSIGSSFSIQLVATQFDYESDAFGNGYDSGATWPNDVVIGGNSASASVSTTADGKNASEVDLISEDGDISATVPAGVQLEPGTTEVKLTVGDVSKSEANITLDTNEVSFSIDVHINGVAENNTVPMSVKINKLMPAGLNEGSRRLFHVEDGKTIEMTLLAAGDTPVQNSFEYEPVTGNVTLYLASFSEITVVANEKNPWKGGFDYSWYAANKTELFIANADQLAAFGAIVGGMNGQTKDSFKYKTVKLVADINLGDVESENNPDLIFYPIGYYNSEGTYERTNTAITSGLRNFEGIFDGGGHTIANFYQNTWEMKGDHDWYSPEEQYYRDGMGLFGKVYGGTVKNLTVKNFSSDGEIATTGVIAAYADGATFENIAILNCNPRVYNIGNGGIVGCVGWYAKEADLKTTFKNITVDNSNKISALWGSYDVACGGIVGQYYPTSGQTSAGTPKNAGIELVNCNVSAIMDVYNDVCANYQYYAYRYTGMLIGSVRENVTIDGKSYPKMDGITASGCTVHFGTWNDYYYCEIIDNTTASYTHDYQMSRLTEIKAIEGTTITYLDDTTGTVPESGRANYVIVDYTKGHGTENATCYHFKDGAVWTHDMGGIQTGIDENGDGQDDLKEDKQHIYLEFNNLVTGYGWGVTSKGINDKEFVNVKDRETASGQKFDVVPSDRLYLAVSGSDAVQIGTLFTVKNGAEINESGVYVSVERMDSASTANATFTPSSDLWENGTIAFTGSGLLKLTIQDYDYCTPTVLYVEVREENDGVKYYSAGETMKSPIFWKISGQIGSEDGVAFTRIMPGSTVEARELHWTNQNDTTHKHADYTGKSLNLDEARYVAIKLRTNYTGFSNLQFAYNLCFVNDNDEDVGGTQSIHHLEKAFAGSDVWTTVVIDLKSYESYRNACDKDGDLPVTHRLKLVFPSDFKQGEGHYVDIAYMAILDDLTKLSEFDTSSTVKLFSFNTVADTIDVPKENVCRHITDEEVNDNTYSYTCKVCGYVYTKTIDDSVNYFISPNDFTNKAPYYHQLDRNRLSLDESLPFGSIYSTSTQVSNKAGQILFARDANEGGKIGAPFSIGKSNYLVVKMRVREATSVQFTFSTSAADVGKKLSVELKPAIIEDNTWKVFVFDLEKSFSNAYIPDDTDGSYRVDTFYITSQVFTPGNAIDVAYIAFVEDIGDWSALNKLIEDDQAVVVEGATQYPVYTENGACVEHDMSSFVEGTYIAVCSHCGETMDYGINKNSASLVLTPDSIKKNSNIAGYVDQTVLYNNDDGRFVRWDNFEVGADKWGGVTPMNHASKYGKTGQYMVIKFRVGANDLKQSVLRIYASTIAGNLKGNAEINIKVSEDNLWHIAVIDLSKCVQTPSESFVADQDGYYVRYLNIRPFHGYQTSAQSDDYMDIAYVAFCDNLEDDLSGIIGNETEYEYYEYFASNPTPVIQTTPTPAE